MATVSIVMLIVLGVNVLTTSASFDLFAQGKGSRPRWVHREFTHETRGGATEQISEDVVLQPAQRKVSITAWSKNPRHPGHIQLILDFNKDVLGFAVPRAQRCYLMTGLAESGVTGQEGESSEAESADSGEEQLLNHVVLRPVAGRPLAQVDQLPAELVEVCRHWPVYEVTAVGPGEQQEEESPGDRQQRGLTRVARHHSRSRGHSRGRSRSRSRGHSRSRSRSHSRSRGSHSDENRWGGFNPDINFNVGGCVAIFSSEVCLTENNYNYYEPAPCQGYFCR